jgi:hypothetical protein
MGMEQQPDIQPAQEISLTMEVVAQDPQNADVALLDGVRRDSIAALRAEGHTVKPVDTGAGTRGGIFVDLVTFALTYKDQIDIISALISIATPIVALAQSMWQAYEKRAGKEVAQHTPMTIDVAIDGAHITLGNVPVKDATEASNVALALAKQLQSSHPTPVTPQSEIKVTANVPAGKPRKRR